MRAWMRAAPKDCFLTFEGANFRTLPITVSMTEANLLNDVQMEALVRIAVKQPGRLTHVQLHLVQSEGFDTVPCTLVWTGDVQT
jgi:hypothetical protein